MARTTGLKEGELIMAARVSRVLAPLTSRLCAMGVAQLVQTPAGAPASEPQRMFAVVEAKRLGRLVWASMVIMAAPKGRAKYIPKRLV